MCAIPVKKAVTGLFPPDKLKVHDRFIGFIQGAHVESDPRLGEKYKEVKRRNEMMKRRFDGTKVVYEWSPPQENGLSHSILLGTWAEGLEGVQPDVHQLLEVRGLAFLSSTNGTSVLNVENIIWKKFCQYVIIDSFHF